MKKKSVYFLWAFIIFTVVTSCRKDTDIITDNSAMLEFSTDSVEFDTVFTTVGSATQNFVIYNRNSKPINISSINLGAGGNSNYRLNVDGTPGKSFTNIIIGPDDSLWVFVEVTINPQDPKIAFLVTDSILFSTNGNLQWINLMAFGRKAHFHKPPPNKGSLFYLNDTVNAQMHWIHDAVDSLPHVIYGYALVGTGQKLTIDAGVQVYFHPHSGLIVMSAATLEVNGVAGTPVTFLNDRLGVEFAEVPGQWDRIWLSSITENNLNGIHDIGPGTLNCKINYAVIKNAFIGLHVDTAYNTDPNTSPQINNTIIENAAGVGLLGQGATLRCTNSLFANCGQYVAALAYGGDYMFRQCTFANYWNQGSSSRQTPSIFINNYFEANGTTYFRPIQQAYFGNCIVYGNMNGEIGLDSAKVGGSNFKYMFDHSLISINDTISTSNPDHFDSYSSGNRNQDPGFTDPTVNNYIPISTSRVIDVGDPAILNKTTPFINTDLLGAPRPQGPTGKPDLGAYEVR